METNTEYKNQEELYQRIVDQYGRDRHGNVCFDINDTGASYELIHKGLRKHATNEPYYSDIIKEIGLNLELPVAIGERATCNVVMHARTSNDPTPEKTISTLEALMKRRNYIRKAAGILKQFTVQGIELSSEKYKSSERGFEIVYDIPIRSEANLADVVNLFTFKHLNFY